MTEPPITVYICPECKGQTRANDGPCCFDCLLMEGRKVFLEPRAYIPALVCGQARGDGHTVRCGVTKSNAPEKWVLNAK